MTQKTEKITKEMMINELIEKHPEVAPVLMGYGLNCVGCHFSSFDTIQKGAEIHGMPKDVFEMMLKDINTIVSERIKIS
jgi:hybrid cluster-associated redox disulfide protein|tara:strand:- start:58 stop:294 length:237 start_codon:yes stop_codon:yes gene_type:complete